MTSQRLTAAAALLLGSALLLSACGNGSTPTETACHLPPDGASGPRLAPLTGGKGLNLVTLASVPLPDGWVQEELALEGTATSYASQDPLPADGTFKLTEKATADYRTRIVVRRPGSAERFNGTVVVEWLNVSGGIDASPEQTFLHDELVRGGYAWVGVSAQYVGIEGGKSPLSPSSEPSPALRDIDSERYGTLHHPGDAFAYDIFTQVARALRAGSCVLGDLVPKTILAAGESQSAFMLTTYVDGVQPLAAQYDGFLIHSRAGGVAPLGEPGAPVAFLSAISGTPTRIRTDLTVPVLVLETETDVLNLLQYFPARQPDGDRFRLWEVAGTAHADLYLLGAAADMFKCDAPINSGPAHFVVKAALRHLDAWARGGAPPPEGDRFQIDTTKKPAYVRTPDGLMLGGVRTPEVDVPVDVLSGDPYGGSVLCLLFGSTTPLSAQRLAELYTSKEAYSSAYTKAADAAIAAGFVLAEDRDALLADAKPSRIAP
jgi:hypothetical protein